MCRSEVNLASASSQALRHAVHGVKRQEVDKRSHVLWRRGKDAGFPDRARWGATPSHVRNTRRLHHARRAAPPRPRGRRLRSSLPPLAGPARAGKQLQHRRRSGLRYHHRTVRLYARPSSPAVHGLTQALCAAVSATAPQVFLEGGGNATIIFQKNVRVSIAPIAQPPRRKTTGSVLRMATSPSASCSPRRASACVLHFERLLLSLSIATVRRRLDHRPQHAQRHDLHRSGDRSQVCCPS